MTGSGTNNYVAKWTGVSSQGNSLLQDNGNTMGIGALNAQTVWNVASASTITSGAQYGQILSTTVNPSATSSATNTAFRNFLAVSGAANITGPMIATSSVISDINTGSKTIISGADISITSQGGTTTTVNGQAVTIAYGNTPVTATTMRGFSAVLKGSATTGSCYYGRAETFFVRTPTNFRVFDADLSSVVSATTANPYGFYQSGNPSGARNYMQSPLGLNTTAPNAAAQLDVTSTTSGVLFPRMTTTQRNLITATDGLVIYNTTDTKLQVYAGGAWVNLH